MSFDPGLPLSIRFRDRSDHNNLLDGSVMGIETQAINLLRIQNRYFPRANWHWA
jgi:hypothetical protein